MPEGEGVEAALEGGTSQQHPGPTIVQSVDPLLRAEQLKHFSPSAPFTCRRCSQENCSRIPSRWITHCCGEKTGRFPGTTPCKGLTGTGQCGIQRSHFARI